MKRHVVGATALTFVLLVFEGVCWPDAPLSMLHFAYLPVLFAPRAGPVWIGLGLLALAEWSLGRAAFGAAASTAASITFVWHLVREDVNAESPWLALAIMPAIEFLRHGWVSVFAAQYGSAAVPPFPWPHLVVEPLIGIPLLAAWFHWRRRDSRWTAGAFAR